MEPNETPSYSASYTDFSCLTPYHWFHYTFREMNVLGLVTEVRCLVYQKQTKLANVLYWTSPKLCLCATGRALRTASTRRARGRTLMTTTLTLCLAASTAAPSSALPSNSTTPSRATAAGGALLAGTLGHYTEHMQIIRLNRNVVVM